MRPIVPGGVKIGTGYTALSSRAGMSLKSRMGRRNHYHVYVIEFSSDLLYEARFKRANPDYLLGMPCVYVGMTGLDPDVLTSTRPVFRPTGTRSALAFVCCQPFTPCTTRCPMPARRRWKSNWASDCVRLAMGCGRHKSNHKHMMAAFESAVRVFDSQAARHL